MDKERMEELRRGAARFFEKGKEWIVQNKKVSIPAVAIVLVLLLVGVSLLASRKENIEETEETAQESSELTAIPVPEVPLEENAVDAINLLMKEYHAALADGDMDRLLELTNYISETDKIRIEKKSEYIEEYQNIVVYTKTGLVEGSYIAYVYSEVKLEGIDTPSPALYTYVVYQNENGGYYIYDGDLDENVMDYFKELSSQNDVTNLCNTVQANYNEAIQSDEALNEFMDAFPGMIEEEVARALAESQMADAGAQAVNEEPGEETPAAEEPKVKVTEVETTDTVNVRSSDSEKADKLGKAAKGTRLPLLEKRENGWSKIEFEGKEAFIKTEFLADVVNLVEEGSENANAGAAAEAPAAETKPSGGPVGKDGKITAKTTVNVRASANENGEKLGTIYKGEKLELVMEQADGWCKVKYKGKTAYVKTEFVE